MHGFALSLIKGDFQAMFGREIDQRRLGINRLSEAVFMHARDIATVVITHTSSAVVLPIPSRAYGNYTAPTRIANIKPPPALLVSKTAAAAQPTAVRDQALASAPKRHTPTPVSEQLAWEGAAVKHIRKKVKM